MVCEGVSLDQAKKSRGVDLLAGAAPMPREMSFPLGASESWNDVYDYIRCITRNVFVILNVMKEAKYSNTMLYVECNCQFCVCI